MKQNLILMVSLLALSLLITACNTAIPTQVINGPIVSTLPVLPSETAIPTGTAAVPLATYQDTASGFTFDYPDGWMLDTIKPGSRAPNGYQITSWSHDPGVVSDVPAGGTIINIVIQLWDPKGDISAFVENRMQAWEASSIAIMTTEDITLGNNIPAKMFIVKGADGVEGYFLFSTLGDNYLVVSGSGDLEKIDLVARSIR